MPATTADERFAKGRRARTAVPRSAHADWQPPADRASPLSLLENQERTRVPELIPIRHERMSASPFTFFRGAATVMAADLASTPSTGISVQLCGDAHLSNFGGFAAPDRRLVVDINDFDETLRGPWEWDVKRLAASMSVAARDIGFGRKQRREITTAAVASYRTWMRKLAQVRNIDVWYARIEADAVLAQVRDRIAKPGMKRVERDLRRAQHKDSLRALNRLTETVDGEPRFVSDPPLLVPLRDLAPAAEPEALREGMQGLLRVYRASLRDDVRLLLDNYRFVDMARKVVGVGSVGTRAWVLLFLGRDERDALCLQAKEAEASVLESVLRPSPYRNHGRRVVEGQRQIQSASDVFLGWVRVTGIDGRERDFYLRQLWDWKLSAEVEAMQSSGLKAYGELCGATLARAHARTGDRLAIAGYLGSGPSFERAIAEFAEAYADQNEADFREFADGVDPARAGQVSASASSANTSM